jgi:peptidoglycan/xylan/chitin deacetylase (PgdA/CDA1 family)
MLLTNLHGLFPLYHLRRMHRYFIKTPWIVKQIFPAYVWSMPSDGSTVYLSFDDGPHPEITPWVLEELGKAEALATFFCIGNNVANHPGIYQRITQEGHAVGNHTHHHLNGWKTPEKEYLADVGRAAGLIRSNLFRPPYGKIRTKQAKQIPNVLKTEKAKIIMWDVLSADFDAAFSPAQCLDNIVRHVEAGSIVVFHDSEKAWKNLKWLLPRVLAFLKDEGYRLKKIDHEPGHL